MAAIARFRLVRLVLAASLAVLTAGPALPRAQTAAQSAQAAALTASERQAIVDALAQTGDDASPLDDDALIRAVLAHAQREMGLRLRPRAVDDLWGLAPPRRDPQAEFAAARSAGTLAPWLDSLMLRHPLAAPLNAARDRYRTAAYQSLGALPTLRAGTPHPAIPLIRARLAEEGFAAAAPADPALFDEALKAAVIDFQARHRLAPDGIIGPATRGALDVSPLTRLRQIEANLERLRWLPRELPAERMEINIAAAEAALYRDGQPALRMKIVVGDPGHKTPIFASRLEAVVFNPPWNVPTSIATNEILPRLARDPGYLARNNFVRIDGRLQQRPGPNNALGQIKFDLPSPYGVYLHDTPGKTAFERPVRTLSHGCMRLEKPRELAVLLLGAQGWSADGVEAAIAAGETRRVALQRSVPLFVTYQTAILDEDGKLRFVPDVYGWDEKLAAALEGAGFQVAQARPESECASTGDQSLSG